MEKPMDYRIEEKSEMSQGVYDFEEVYDILSLKVLIRMINRNGWKLICVTQHEDRLIVFFWRPAE